MENRIGEPAANPYLYILSQIVAGLDGIEHKLEPGPPDDEPYAADRPMLPQSLPAALGCARARTALSRQQLGEVFVDYFLKLKRNEAGRFAQWLQGRRQRRRVTSRPSGSRMSISIFSRRMQYSGMRPRAELAR